MQLNMVVFPAPLGPIRPRIAPSETSKDTPSRATIPPNRMLTPRMESRAFAMPVSLSAAGPPSRRSCTAIALRGRARLPRCCPAGEAVAHHGDQPPDGTSAEGRRTGRAPGAVADRAGGPRAAMAVRGGRRWGAVADRAGGRRVVAAVRGGRRRGAVVGPGGRRREAVAGPDGRHRGVAADRAGARRGAVAGPGGSRQGAVVAPGGSRQGAVVAPGGSRQGAVVAPDGRRR